MGKQGKKVFHVDGENLEELLIYDDVFYDYFMAFLTLPCFPIGITYNRLTGAFEFLTNDEWSSATVKFSGKGRDEFGLTEEEHQAMLDWAVEMRLPFFVKSKLFRDYKLCKLLLRPIASEPPASAAAEERGFSRRSEASSVRSSEEKPPQTQRGWLMQFEKLFKHQRPGSRAFSVPADVGSLVKLLDMSPRGEVFPESAAAHSSQDSPFSHLNISHLTSAQHRLLLRDGLHHNFKDLQLGMADSEYSEPATYSAELERRAFSVREPEDTETGSEVERVVSAPSRYFQTSDGLDEPPKNLVVFNDDVEQRAATASSVSDMEDRHRMTLYEMKQQVLSSLSGMESFKSFITETSGVKLLHYWLEVEQLVDTSHSRDQPTNCREQRTLLRYLMDQCGVSLSEEAKFCVSQATRSTSLEVELLRDTQYDVLRRLRTYWLPRYLLHRERTAQLTYDLATVQRSRWAAREAYVLPSLLLGGSDCSTGQLWPGRSETGRPGRRVRSGYVRPSRSIGPTQSKVLKEKMVTAVLCESIAGFPLKKHFSRNKTISNILAFHQQISELLQRAEELGTDRILRKQQYYVIFNRFIKPNSPQCLDVPDEERLRLDQLLAVCELDDLQPSIWEDVQLLTVEEVFPAWLDYVQADVLRFISCCTFVDAAKDPSLVSVKDGKRQLSGGDVRLIVSEGQVVVATQPWIKCNASPDTPERIKSALPFDAESEAKWRVWLSDQREGMEELRVWQVKMMKARADAERAAVMKSDGPPNMRSFSKAVSNITSKDPTLTTENTKEEAVNSLRAVFSNKGLTNVFKKSVESNKQISEYANLYAMLLQYQQLGGSAPKNQTKQEALAQQIWTRFFDSSTNSDVLVLSEKLANKLSSEAGRPLTPTMNEMGSFVSPSLTEQCKEFMKVQSEILDCTLEELAGMTAEEVRLRYKAAREDKEGGREAKGAGKSPEDFFYEQAKKGGRQLATREDRAELMQLLSKTTTAGMPLKLHQFRRFLALQGDAEKLPFLENSLLFYLEVLRFKISCHPDQDEQLIKKKLNCIVETFLDSAAGANVQLDIPNELAERTVRNCKRLVTANEISPSVFDDIQGALLTNHLYGYFAGFNRRFGSNASDIFNVSTRKEQRQSERLKNFAESRVPPPRDVTVLPKIPKAGHFSLTFSLLDGAQWKEQTAKVLRHKLSGKQGEASITGTPTAALESSAGGL